jgi:hypothetical protein
MWANTVWGFLALAATCLFTVLGLSAEYTWLRPYLLNAAFTSAVASAIAFCWPLIKRGVIGGETRLHPARYSDKDTSLIDTVWWVAERSAWGRWQTAQRAKWADERLKLLNAASFVHVAARNGDLAVRGRPANSIEYSLIARDFWRRVYIDLAEDPNTLWKVVLKPYKSEGAAIPDYDHFLVELRAVESLWPRRNWRTDWQTFRLNFRAVRRMKEHKPEEPPKPAEAKLTTSALPGSPATHNVVVETGIGIETTVETTVAASPNVEIIVTPAAPKNWEQLFVIGDDGKSVWLRFLPDTKHYRADMLVLIVYGQKVLRDVSRIRIDAAHAAVEKTVSNAPNRPKTSSGFFTAMMMIGQLQAAANLDWVDQCVPLYLERVGLSQGGLYQLTQDGERHAATLAYDLIRRA